MTKTPPRAVFVVALVAFTAACGAKRQAAETVPAGHSLIALLPDPETQNVGRATVWTKSGSAELDAERKSVVASNRRLGGVTRLSEGEVERLFARALAALPPEPRSFTLYFKFESDELTEQSLQLVPSILALVKQRSDPEVAAVGHTDTMGPAKANVELGMKRAAYVAKLLIVAGLDAKTLEVVSHGESALLIRTPDETPEPRNRRVEITVR